MRTALISNPFAPPHHPPSSADDQDFVDQVHRELLGARPAQLGLGGCAFFAGTGILFVALLIGVAGAFTAFDGSLKIAGVVASASLVYGLLGLLYVGPAYLLIRAALLLGKPREDRREQVLSVLRIQRRFWRLLGTTLFGLVSVYLLIATAFALFGNESSVLLNPSDLFSTSAD